jgi:polysaccharide export outer membrane protein
MGMSTRIIIIKLILILGLTVSVTEAQDARPQQPIGPSANPPQHNPVPSAPSSRYHLGKGDVIELNFPFTPEFNQTVTVQPDGFVTLQVLGDVNVAGLSTHELKTMLERQYSVALKDPVITVILKEFEKPSFIASGEVQRPGKYEMKDGLMLSQAVAIAGGFTGDAKNTQVLLFRRASDEWVEVKELDMKKLLRGTLREDFEVKPGDMVYVPKRKLAGLRPLMPIGAFVRMSIYPF